MGYFKRKMMGNASSDFYSCIDWEFLDTLNSNERAIYEQRLEEEEHHANKQNDIRQNRK